MTGTPRGSMGREPVRFVFGVHIHQPVGNFGSVFEEHARDVYHPLLELLERRSPGPVLLHVSGPLVEWMEANDAPLVDRIGRMVANGALELLLGGMYEPILAAIPRPDRMEQIVRHREALRARFGAAGDGLWLTERVWEPELPADLYDAGVRYLFVDDRHLLVSGLQRDELHVPWRTEYDSKGVTVLAIDQRLRYLIPFRPPAELDAYVRTLHAAGHPLAVFADDGEKFGGWPGTRKWVYGERWFEGFCDTIDALREAGIARFTTGADVITAVPPGGIAYLPTASYEEMEQWTLPEKGARRLAALRRDLGEVRMAGADGSLVRGGHWRNFLHKYAEANRLHKKMTALSELTRSRGNAGTARRAVLRAQCNDAYWHGVFGGLYHPHLRAALWRELAAAEAELRLGERLAADVVDMDADGSDEIWVHSGAYSAIVTPAHGGSLVEYTRFDTGVNHADTLTRRREPYHYPAEPKPLAREGGTPSIHELEAGRGINVLPPVDLDTRAMGICRIIPRATTPDAYAAADYTPLASWAGARCAVAIREGDDGLTVACTAGGFGAEWRFTPAGLAQATFRWTPPADADSAWFAVEISLHAPLAMDAPDAELVLRAPITTVTRSEREVEEIVQGESVTMLFDAGSGQATITFG